MDEIIGWLKRREQRAQRWRNAVESVIYENVSGQSYRRIKSITRIGTVPLRGCYWSRLLRGMLCSAR